MTRAALYCRKSQPNEDAIERQVDNARAFAESKGWAVVQSYADDGVSGASFGSERPAFTAMLSAAKAQEFDVVVTMAVDRLGREAFCTNMALLELAEAGVAVYTYSDGQEVRVDTPINKIMLGMRSYAAEDYRVQIAVKTREALLAKARAGWATGTKTFGYDLVRVDTHVERRINPAEAKVVVRIFTLAASGLGNRRIVDSLSSVPAPGKKGWSKTVIKVMLANDLYRGVVIFGRSRSAATGGSATKRVRSEPAVTVDMPSLRIIPDDLWNRVQRRQAATLARFSPHRNTDGKLHGRPEAGLLSPHLLNGFGVCGVCGGSMSFQSKGGRARSYYCTRRVTRGTSSCTNSRGVPEGALDEAVIEALHKLVADPEVAWALVCERTERWKRERVIEVGSQREHLEQEERRLEAVVERLLDQVESGTSVGLRLKQRQAELDAIRVKLAEPVAVDLDEDQFKAALERTAQWLRWHGPTINPSAVTQTRAAMRQLGIDKIAITPTETGWTFAGDGNLAGVIGLSRRSPRYPHRSSGVALHRIDCAGKAGARSSDRSSR
jgi:DNA invertase Pin-like site-specific DNA recombinase